MGQGIRAPSVLFVKKIGQWELSLEAKRSTQALPKTSQIIWTASGWSVHSSEETLFLDNMSAPWFILPGTCIAFSELRLFWAQTRRLFASVQSHFETRQPWWFMYDTTDLLYERISTWCPRMSVRKNWQAWHTASISRQLICRPDFSLGWRSVCPRTALPNPRWKRLSWQHSYNRPGLIHRPESPLRSGVRDAKPRMEPSASARTGWVAREADYAEVP